MSHLPTTAPHPAGDAEGADSGTPSTSPYRRWSRRLMKDETGVVLILIVLVAGVGIAYPDFLGTDNLLTTAQNSAYVSLMALGMVFALAMREVDLSVGGSYAMSLVTGALLIRDGTSPWLALPVIVVLGAVLGAFNGALATYLSLPSFIVTLGTSMLYRGAGLALADGKQITDLPMNHSFFTLVGGELLGVPFSLWVLVAAVAVLTVLLTRTRFGARVRAIGSNPDAAEFSGLPIARTRIQVLALSGAMAGLAAVLGLAFYAAGDPTLGQGYELTAIAACIIGGTPLSGGRGSVVGALAGSLILSVVASSLVFFQVPINWTTFATGVVILLAVAADSALRRKRARRGATE